MIFSYGRKIILIVSTIFMAITGIGQALSTSYDAFVFFAFLNAVGTAGVFPMAFIIGIFCFDFGSKFHSIVRFYNSIILQRFFWFLLNFCFESGVEMVGPEKREMSGIVLNYFYSVGEAIVGLISWLYRDWRSLQLWVSVPPLLFIGYYWLVPESVRWLLARKDYRKANKIIKKAAHINGVELSDDVIQTFELESPTHNVKVILLKFSFSRFEKFHENLLFKFRKMTNISNLMVSMMPISIMRCGQLSKNWFDQGCFSCEDWF